METNPRRYGKIAHGLKGMGTVSPEMVERRAAELAVINGRDRFNQDDFRQAKLELLGMEDPIDESAGPDFEAASDIRKNAKVTGESVAPIRLADPQKQIEALIQGGIDEAEHDSMLKGARSGINQE